MPFPKSEMFKTIPEWLKILPSLTGISKREQNNYNNLLKFANGISDIDASKKVVLVRCPGRYRDFAGHTDMKGCGGVLCGTASEEAIYGLYQIRDDEEVVLHNMNPSFKTKRFPISSIRTGLHLSSDLNLWDNWTKKYYEKHSGNPDIYGPFAWDKYIKGFLIFFSEMPATIREMHLGELPGITAVFSSDLSYGGGKSSSSALVVNAALGLDALYNFEKPSTNEWIDLIGMSEWFAMTRGGCADHAHMFYSKENHFTLVGSFPTSLIDETPIPSSLTRVIIHSGIDRPQGRKTLNKLRIGSIGYILSILYIKQTFPHLREELENSDNFYHFGNLREFTTIGGLNNNPEYLFDKILRILPVQAKKEEIYHALPDFKKELDALFSNYSDPTEGYQIRDIALFGLAEIERAVSFMKACKNEKTDEILRLVRFSHDGDRVNKSSLINGKWVTHKYGSSMTDQRLDEIARAVKENPDNPEMHIRCFSGRFKRSIPEMDLLADIVDAHLPNDAAIRVMGAGLGGEMHAFVKDDKLDLFLNIIHEEFFRKIMKIDHPRITILKNSNVGARILSAI
jgi:galactokinase